MSVTAPAKPVYDFALCTGLRKSLYGYACKLSRDKDAAHDLVQDALLRAWRTWPRFAPRPGTTIESAVSCWMHQILHSVFIDTYRKAKVRAHINVKSTSGAQDSPNGHMLGHGLPSRPGCALQHSIAAVTQYQRPPDGREDIETLGDELEAALGDLNPRHRQIVELVGLHDGRYHEVARALGVPVGTVMSSLHRARNRLIARLGRFAAREYGIVDRREGAQP